MLSSFHSIALQAPFPKGATKCTTSSRTAIVGDEKMKKVLVLLVLVLIFFGCVKSTPKQPVINQESKTTEQTNKNNKINNSNAVKLSEVVEKGDKIKVEYIGRFPDTKEVFDKSEGRGPLEFTAGAGQMIKGFDNAVLGMKLNEEKTVVIPPEDAYGSADSGQKVEIALDKIEGGTDLNIGSVIYANNGQKGTILKIKDGTATVEFIHPMAGKTLEFWIKVVEIEKA